MPLRGTEVDCEKVTPSIHLLVLANDMLVIERGLSSQDGSTDLGLLAVLDEDVQRLQSVDNRFSVYWRVVFESLVTASQLNSS